MMESKGHRSLRVYQKAFDLAMKIYVLTKEFPKTETYSLIDQIRRSSRGVCACIAEAYRKRQYPKYFVSKCIDADGENSETIVWIEISLACKYLKQEEFDNLIQLTEEVGRMLNSMIENPEKFLPKEKIKQNE